MNAAHPNATPADAGEARVPEPSMEEILASIRRIIADDQSFPGIPRDAPALRATLEPTAPVHVLHPEPAAPEPRAPEPPPAPAAQASEPPPPAEEPVAEAHEPVRAPEPTIMAPQFPVPPGPAPEPEPPAATHVPREEPVSEPAHMAPSQSAPPHMSPPHMARAHAEPVFSEPRQVEEPAAEPDPYDAPLGLRHPLVHEPRDSGADSLFSAETDHSLTSAFNMLAASRLADNSDHLLAMTREMIRPMLREWLDDNLPSMVERLVRAEIERVSRGGR